MPRVLALLCAVVLAPALAGCGGDDVERNNEYVDSVNTAQAKFSRDVDRLSGQISQSSSPAQDRRTLRAFSTAVGVVVRELRAIEPPEPVAMLHERLVTSIEAYGDEITSVGKAISEDDPDELIQAQERLLKATSTVSGQINKTITAINAELREG